jgi:hypothetical protein
VAAELAGTAVVGVGLASVGVAVGVVAVAVAVTVGDAVCVRVGLAVTVAAGVVGEGLGVESPPGQAPASMAIPTASAARTMRRNMVRNSGMPR